MTDHTGPAGGRDDWELPGELRGFGDLPPGLCRELATDHKWQRWLYDDADGHLLDLGKHHYRPTTQLAAFIAARDRYCRSPGGTRRAESCDNDHTKPYDHHAAADCPAPDSASCNPDQHPGGPTAADNLAALSRRAHRAKTHGHYQTRQDPDGTLHWTTALGRKYTTKPWDYRPHK